MTTIAVFILLVLLSVFCVYVSYKYKIDTSKFNARCVYIMHNKYNLCDKKLMYLYKIKNIFNYYECHCFIDNHYCIIYSKGKILWYEDYFTEPRYFVDICSKKYFLENYKRIPLKIL